MDWLDGFEWDGGLPRAVGFGATGEQHIDDLGTLSKDGLDRTNDRARQRYTTNFADWRRESADRFLTGLGYRPTATERHTVYSFRAGMVEFLVPALTLVRGLFPLRSEAFSWLFSPRSLSLLCAPIERLGHWSVVTNRVRRDGAGTQRPMTESLTWASLYPSANASWRSVYSAAMNGRMHIDLPAASVRVLPKGITRNGVVYVTELVVSALLAHEDPFSFADKAPSAFLWSTMSESLGPRLNDYRDSVSRHPFSEALRMSDEEWLAIQALCMANKNNSDRPGRAARLNQRDLVDSFIVRAATGARWQEVAVGSLRPYSVEQSWKNWRVRGRLDLVLAAISAMRGGRIAARADLPPTVIGGVAETPMAA